MILLRKYQHLFKYIVFTLGFLTLISSLWLFSNIISRLEDKAHKSFKFQIEIFETFLKSSGSDDVTFLFQNLVSNTVYPVIYTSTDSIPLYHANLGLKREPLKEELKEYLKSFRSYAEPIPVRYENQVLGYYFYGEPSDLKQLRWLPYIISFLVILLLWIAYQGYKIIRSNEVQYLWVGMSKETAHQLGTPISSLFGWLELLKSDKNNLNTALPEIEKDILRLKTVSQRFSKIGSKPKLETINLIDLIKDAVNYFIARTGVNIIFRYPEAICKIDGSTDLLFWVFENLIRNSIDASNNKDLKIEILMTYEESFVDIYFQDNGHGIENKKQKSIFEPGFTTKKRGWGLGLSLSKRIINEYHNGKINLKNSSPEGTTFHIRLKLINE